MTKINNNKSKHNPPIYLRRRDYASTSDHLFPKAPYEFEISLTKPLEYSLLVLKTQNVYFHVSPKSCKTDPTIFTEGFHVAGKNVHIVTKFSFLLGIVEQLKLMINTQVYSHILKAF